MNLSSVPLTSCQTFPLCRIISLHPLFFYLELSFIFPSIPSILSFSHLYLPPTHSYLSPHLSAPSSLSLHRALFPPLMQQLELAFSIKGRLQPVHEHLNRPTRRERKNEKKEKKKEKQTERRAKGASRLVVSPNAYFIESTQPSLDNHLEGSYTRFLWESNRPPGLHLD